MIGTELAVSAFINPILEKLEDRARLTAVRLFASKLGFAMPFWYALGFFFLLAVAFLFLHQPGFPLVAAAAAIWAVVIVLTLLFLVPINNRMARLSPDAAAGESLRQHRKWDLMHRVRVGALTAAMLLFLLGVYAR